MRAQLNLFDLSWEKGEIVYWLVSDLEHLLIMTNEVVMKIKQQTKGI